MRIINYFWAIHLRYNKSVHLLSVVMLSGLQQLWDQTAPALLQQLSLQRHLRVLTHPLLMGGVQHRVQACLRDQLLVE